jgi:hypothetical protein
VVEGYLVRWQVSVGMSGVERKISMKFLIQRPPPTAAVACFELNLSRTDAAHLAPFVARVLPPVVKHPVAVAVGGSGLRP